MFPKYIITISNIKWILNLKRKIKMIDRITLSENQDPEISLIYKYEFKIGCDLEHAGNVAGVDLRDEMYETLLTNFKYELYSKIYGVDRLDLRKK